MYVEFFCKSTVFHFDLKRIANKFYFIQLQLVGQLRKTKPPIQNSIMHGKRFKEEVLEVQYKGKSIFDVLDMSVDEAILILTPNGKHNALRGKYNTKGCNLFIQALHKNDKVKMEGNITGNTLKLTVTNLKDKSFEEFVFKYQK